MTLTQEDKATPLYLKLKKYMEARIVTLRASNDGDLSDVETAKLRGRIAEVKGFLSLGDDRPVTE